MSSGASGKRWGQRGDRSHRTSNPLSRAELSLQGSEQERDRGTRSPRGPHSRPSWCEESGHGAQAGAGRPVSQPVNRSRWRKTGPGQGGGHGVLGRQVRELHADVTVQTTAEVAPFLSMEWESGYLSLPYVSSCSPDRQTESILQISALGCLSGGIHQVPGVVGGTGETAMSKTDSFPHPTLVSWHGH